MTNHLRIDHEALKAILSQARPYVSLSHAKSKVLMLSSGWCPDEVSPVVRMSRMSGKGQ